MSENSLKPHQQRVVEEEAALNEKVAKLVSFMSDPASVFSSLPSDEQFRLRVQLAAMTIYANVLAERIAHFEVVHG